MHSGHSGGFYSPEFSKLKLEFLGLQSSLQPCCGGRGGRGRRGGPTSRNTEPTKLRAASSVLKVGTSHTPGQDVDVHPRSGPQNLKVVAGAGIGQLDSEEVEANAPTAKRWSRERVQQAGWRQVVCLDALTCRAGGHVLLHSRRQAGPPHQDSEASQGNRLVMAKVLAQRSGMQLVQQLCLKRAGHAEDLAVRAETVE